MGGICPLIILHGVQAVTGATFIVPAVVLAVTGVITAVAAMLLIKFSSPGQQVPLN